MGFQPMVPLVFNFFRESHYDMPRPGFMTARFATIAGIMMAMMVAAMLLTLSASAVFAQANFDRPGSDYARRRVPSGDPVVCALTCERDRRCRAWSFSYPANNPDGAVCWLKNGVPPRVQSNCCITGVRGAGVVEPRNKTLEIAIDRLGGDYRNLTVAADGQGESCRTACDADKRCRAWTYARPGYIGKEARCFLKDHIKPPRRKPGFISGVVR